MSSATQISNAKLIDFEGLRKLREHHAREKLVHCHGVFDVLHGGHLSYFESAKRFGDRLIVTITADRFVNKGPNRPCFSALIRARMVAALSVVDFVCIVQFPSATEVIERLRPDFYVKGPDYRDKAADETGAIYREENAVQACGGRLVFTEDETYSSTKLINKLFAPWSEDQLRIIKSAREAGKLSLINGVLSRVALSLLRHSILK